MKLKVPLDKLSEDGYLRINYDPPKIRTSERSGTHYVDEEYIMIRVHDASEITEFCYSKYETKGETFADSIVPTLNAIGNAFLSAAAEINKYDGAEAQMKEEIKILDGED